MAGSIDYVDTGGDTRKLCVTRSVPPTGAREECIKFTIYCDELGALMKEINTEWIWNYNSESIWNNMISLTNPPAKNYFIKTEHVDDFEELCSCYAADLRNYGHPTEDNEQETALTREATEHIYALYKEVMS